MHPVEHLLYFAVVCPHMFVVGHPIHLFFNAQHTGLTPAGGHHGFEGPVKGPGPTKFTGSYFHYLHHRYFGAPGPGPPQLTPHSHARGF
jgi:sterol desaturase/sphingolipid hydroxylase (fatty acid hydroxylase superfamily)